MDMHGGFLTAIYVLLSMINVGAASHRKGILFCKTKSILMLVLMAVYAVNSSTLLLSVVLALLCAWLGDVLLLYRGNASLTWGGLAFIFCHLLYIWTFWQISYPHSEWQSYVIVALLYIFVGKLFYTGFIRNFYELNDFLKCGIGLYLLIILMMSFSSSLIIRANNIYTFAPFIGSLLFLFSDYLLAIGYKMQNTFLYYPWAMASYLTAQLLIIGGLVLLEF